MDFSRYIWILLNMVETGIFFYLITGIFREDSHAGRTEEVIRYVIFFAMEVILAERYRIGSVFSGKMFLFTIFVLISGTCLVYRRQILTVTGSVLIYSSVVLLLMYLAVFLLSIAYSYGTSGEWGNSFTNTNEQFIVLRSAVLWVVFFTVRKIRSSGCGKVLSDHAVLSVITGAGLAVLVLEYQNILEYGFLYFSFSLPIIRIILRDSMLSMLVSVALLAVFGIFYLKNRIMKQEHEFLLLKEELERKKYEELMAVLYRNRELVHDTKNHLLVIHEYGKNGDYDRLCQYVEYLMDSFVHVTPGVFSGNKVLDLLLSQKKTEALEKGICFQEDITPLSGISLSDPEICELFGNLLDNAVEACESVEGIRKIVLTVRQQNQMLFLEIRNTIQEKPVRSGRYFVTRKKQKENHGFGLRSVERIVKEHDGLIEYHTDQEWFTVTVTFFCIDD